MPTMAMRKHRLHARVAAAAIVVTFTLCSYLTVRYLGRARLHAEQDLPADVSAEVDAVWQDFNDLFADHVHCFDDVSLLLVAELEGGDARYVISEARIEIKIPTSPRRFRDSLAHELAHHLEHTCGSFSELRDDFESLPGIEGAWTGGADWQQTPAELYAETVVELVNGERVRHGRSMPLPPGALALVESWARRSSAG